MKHKKFIEVSKEVIIKGGDRVLLPTYLNVGNIIYFYEHATGSIVQTIDGGRMWVAENPETLKKKIEEDV